ncbi:MAG TPA: ATP-binding protein [Acidimicrobiia bacterium]|nr:ATP-binding protein [Acidimicrobiia bacterium]
MHDDRVQTEFASRVTTPASVRAFLRTTLQTWALDGLGELTELLADELVSNVVRHVGEPMTVRAIRSPTRIRIEVDDPSTDPPVLQHPDRDTPRGRGIMLVDALATRWGTDVHPSGKTVWFEIEAP